MPGTDGTADARVLIVDDGREVADAYALCLRGYCEVETAYGGEEALSVIRDSPVNIVLLDRHMPGLSGDDVLTELDEHNFSGCVVMVTAVDPGVEVLDTPFDDYLCKPVDREDARVVIDQQQRILAYETFGEFSHVEAKCVVLEAELSPERRHEHEGYDETAARVQWFERRTRWLLPDDNILDQFDEIECESVWHSSVPAEPLTMDPRADPRD